MPAKTTRSLAAAALVACALFGPVPAAPIVNGGFESGLTGWTKVDQLGSDSTFAIQTGATSPVNGFSVPAPPQGLAAAMSDAQGPGSHVLYQDIAVPSGSGPFTLGFALFIRNAEGAGDFFVPAALTALDFATPALNQQARVDLLPTSADPLSLVPADILQNLYATAPGDPLASGYTHYVVDVTSVFQAHSGGTLRLRFAEVDNVSPFTLGVDDVGVVASLAAAKTVAGSFTPGGTVVYTVTLTNRGLTAMTDNPGDEFTDALPAELLLVSATATAGTAVATVATRTVTWNGGIAAGGTVTISIQATVGSGVANGTTVSNQGTASFDGDGNGTNESAAGTDDPTVGGLADPTRFVVAGQSVLVIPTLDGLGLAGLVLVLALAAVLTLRRRPRVAGGGRSSD